MQYTEKYQQLKTKELFKYVHFVVYLSTIYIYKNIFACESMGCVF